MKKRENKKDTYLKKDSSAVVGIVTAILLVGLFVSVFAIVQTVYVPQWMEEIEAEHMNEVAKQVSQMKFATDLQLHGTSQTVNLSISSPITLGSGKIPYLLSERSSGTLSISENSTTFTISNATHSSTIVLNAIQYQSYNTYYVDQIYTYEAGAIVTGQEEGSFLSAPPFFSMQNQSIDTMTLTLVNVTSIGGKTSASGYDTTSIRTQYDPTFDQALQYTNLTTLWISTQYPAAWSNYFNDTLTDAGLTYGLSNDYMFDLSTELKTLTITFFTTNSLNISLKTLTAQISPGWIT
jgi:hypothetical protein